MRKIILYIAISLDGYIATKDDGLDWLINFPNKEGTDYGYDEFYEKGSTIIMGKSTYRVIKSMGDDWIYSTCDSHIVTSQPEETDLEQNIHFITSNLEEKIKELRQQQGKAIWLMGGGQLVAKFLELELVDTMIITTMPVILGNGIPLFPPHNGQTQWTISNTRTYNNGVQVTEYEREYKKLK